ncbi:MAG: hypothetical protein ABIT20_11805 [Gemmatimonadaceae bacterium]
MPIVLALLAALQAQSVDSAASHDALREATTACQQDAGALWGRSLCGPIALVDRRTRQVIANDTNPPRGAVFANTSVTWAGRSWAMVVLPLPTDRFDRVALVMHEVFHREQAALGLAGMDPPNNQLDQRDGRRWFRLELRALAAALETDDRTARSHIEDALSFRARRRALYPLADSLEPALEMQEGLAEYTGDRIAMTLTGETASRVARRVREFQSTPTYVRSFAYATGPALGLLLDRFAVGWRDELARTPDPARILARRMRFQPPRDAERRARRYGVAAIDRDEAARDAARRGPMRAYRKNLVDGPVLTLTQSSLNRNFDPQSLVGFDIMNTIYPTGVFSAAWGSLEVTSGGTLVANDFGRIQVGAPAAMPSPDARVIRGDGWVLTLGPEWSMVPAPGRSRSYVLRKGGP